MGDFMRSEGVARVTFVDLEMWCLPLGTGLQCVDRELRWIRTRNASVSIWPVRDGDCACYY